MTGGGVVLILTHPADVHADAVQARLARGGVSVHRIDTGTLGTDLALTARLHHGTLTGRLGSCDLSSVTCVWHRRPADVTATDPDDAAELRAGLGGILATLPHLNHPAAMAAAALKPYQLALAGRHGFAVPETVVTTDARSTRRLRRRYSESVVVKPMSRRAAALIVEGDRAGWCRPIHLTQQRIEKTADIRLTVVDDRAFAVRITSPHMDWRTDHDTCAYKVVATPPEVAGSVRSLLTALRLRYAAIDFALGRDGCWWFLEVNPNGQWLWLEHATGLPISEAVANALATRG